MTALPENLTANAPVVARTHFLRRVLKQPVAVICAALLLTVVVLCALAPIIAADPLAQDLTSPYAPPGGQHLLGSDQLGRDILSRLLHGGQTTLVGAVQAVLVYAVLGMVFGMIAGSAGGTIESVIMRINDMIQSIPALVVLLVVLAIFGNSELAAMVSLGILAAPGLVRVIRSATMAVRAEQFVAAARVAGLSGLQIQLRHVLPALAGPAMTYISIFAGIAILFESVIGFLGLGVVPPQPSWGNLIADAQQSIALNPWMLVPTGGTVALVTIALTLLGDGIRAAYSARSTRSGLQLSWKQMAAKTRTDPLAGTEDTDLPSGAKPLLSVRGLTVNIAGDTDTITLVDGVSFDVAAGEAVGLVGESGCGKSITVTSLLRVLPPGATVGGSRVEFEGTDLLALSEAEMAKVRGAGIAYISQEPISSLDPMFTAGQQIAEAVRQHRKVSRREARAIALDLLAQVRLPDPAGAAKRYPHELSGGMAQRVAIARALAGEPKLLIADEPTTALDVTVQAEILDLLRDLRQRTGMALILVTHDWGVLADACDRAFVMYAGQIVETAPLQELVTAPSMPYTWGLLNSMPADVEPGAELPVVAGNVPSPGRWPKGCRFAQRCIFASAECRENPIPLVEVSQEQLSRCIHVDELRKEESHDLATA
ncbi:dipeptide/oligopeptide/nickel ABC transporter permease/ATP-binding protein [Paenarthrobacter sp. NPDC058040]|uniref:dipeptide/oligopeptide/nickel ABC transporter permease/ATP-binding protein n=1 Tax=unclassified Paenarthrobacter TaxID=2634190 RepID=UPI0036DF5FE4